MTIKAKKQLSFSLWMMLLLFCHFFTFFVFPALAQWGERCAHSMKWCRLLQNKNNFIEESIIST